jgi:hypothetical protein
MAKGENPVSAKARAQQAGIAGEPGLVDRPGNSFFKITA